MHLPSVENPSVRYQEPLPSSKQGTGLQSKGIKTETEDLVKRQKATIDAQTAEILKLRRSKEKHSSGYKTAKERIAELEHEIEDISRVHEEALEKQNQRIRAMEDQLKRTKKPSAAKSTARTSAKSSLSASNRISEAEVLGVVRDLNENVFQVAANLTEEWEELGSSRTDRFAITAEDIEPFSRSYGPALVHQVFDRNPAAVTFLVQSCLCEFAAEITSSWQNNEELRTLRTVYQLASSSAKGREVLTQSHSSERSSYSNSITQRVADILWITGLFPSARHSFDFVKAKAPNRIETIDRLVRRLESIFMVDILCSDMCLLVEAPSTLFNHMRATKEVESYEVFTPGRKDIVAGTTEVGIEKSVGEGQGEGRRTEILMKAKVVLEVDLTD